jgi:hypothetical protein
MVIFDTFSWSPMLLLYVEYLASMLEDAIVQRTRREIGFVDEWQVTISGCTRVRAVMPD